MNIKSASGFPTPKTVCVREHARCAHLVQAQTRWRIGSSSSALSSGGCSRRSMSDVRASRSEAATGAFCNRASTIFDTRGNRSFDSRIFSSAARTKSRAGCVIAAIMRNFARERNLFDHPTMSARLSDYDYDLPKKLIAQRPPERREDARMMVLHRASQMIEHRQFRELKTFLQPGDLLVLNDTRVLPARRFSDDGTVEFLFLERLGPKRWKCLVKPGQKMRVGATASIDNAALRVDEITADGERIVALDGELDPYSGGSMPLPAHIQ